MIIGVAGYKNAGKDTVADWFVANQGFTKIGFADPVKDVLCALTGLNRIELELLKNDSSAHLGVGYINNPTTPPEGVDVSFAEQSDGSVRMWSPIVDPITIRHVLQKIGTEVGREIIGEDTWVKLLDECIGNSPKNYVINDVRFENECNYIHDCGGLVIRVHRRVVSVDSHQSEDRLPDELINYEIDNLGTKDELYHQLNELMIGQESYGS